MRFVFGCLLALVFSASALAHEWDCGQTTYIVLPVGSKASLAILEKFKVRLRQTYSCNVEVLPKTGNHANIGIKYVASRSAKDHLLLWMPSSAVLNPAVSLVKGGHMPYNPLTDLQAISLFGTFEAVVVVRPGLGIWNLQDLVNYAKTHPGKLNWADSTMLSATFPTFFGEFQKNIVYIPYKDESQVLASKDFEATLSTASSAVPLVDSKMVRPLATLGVQRLALFPSVPTMRESGFPDFPPDLYFGALAGPKDLPERAVQELSREVAAFLATPGVKEEIQSKFLLTPKSTTPEETRQLLSAQFKLWEARARAYPELFTDYSSDE